MSWELSEKLPQSAITFTTWAVSSTFWIVTQPIGTPPLLVSPNQVVPAWLPSIVKYISTKGPTPPVTVPLNVSLRSPLCGAALTLTVANSTMEVGSLDGRPGTEAT